MPTVREADPMTMRSRFIFRHLLVVFAFFLLGGAHTAQSVEFAASKFRDSYLFGYYFASIPGTTPWWPCWSPDGKWIAFSMYGSIWKVNVATDEAFELTQGAALHSSPTWSPDGKWIVYTAEDNWQSSQLEILNVETGETRALTQDGQVYTDPAFSPDGRWLAYVTTKPDGYLNVVARAIQDGHWSGDEMEITRDHDSGRPRLYFSNWDLHIEPAWFKDSRELLLVSNRDVLLGSGNLWRVPFQPDAMSHGRVILNEQSLYRTRPDVSPDGRRVIYSSSAGAADEFDHLYVLPVEGGQPYKLTFGDHDDFHPRWSPDGQWIAYISNESGLPGLYLLETYGGAKRKLVTGKLHWKLPMGTARVTVRDEATGKLAAVRISGRASDGKLYAPANTEVMGAALVGGIKPGFYSDGSFKVEAPAGEMTIEVTKGYEYVPETRKVIVRPDETVDVNVSVRHWIQTNSLGWFSGTTHAHMNYGGEFHHTPQTLLRMGRAEGLNIVTDLVANKDNRVIDWEYFRKGGGADPVSDLPARSMLIVGEEYRPPFWGHVSFIGLKDHLVSPFLTGYEGTALASLYPSNSDMFEKARAQGAATGYVHAFNAEGDPLQRDLSGARGFPVDLALGLIDSMEFTEATRGSLIPIFKAWNNDFYVAPVGGEDTLGNIAVRRPVGILRTYAYLGSNFTARAWVNAIKQGHTGMTSGPVIMFRLNGKMPGDAVSFPGGGPHLLRLEGTVRSVRPIHKVLIYHNGAIWKEFHPAGDPRGLSFREDATVSASGWFAVVAEGDNVFSPSPQTFSEALTNCIRVYVRDLKIRDAESARYFLQWIDKLRTLAEATGLWRSPQEKEHVFAPLQRAEEIYKQRLAESTP